MDWTSFALGAAAMTWGLIIAAALVGMTRKVGKK